MKTHSPHITIEYLDMNKQKSENLRQSNPSNTNERDQASTQRTQKTDQRKNNHRKAKVTTKPENTCLMHQKHNHKLRGEKHLTN